MQILMLMAFNILGVMEFFRLLLPIAMHLDLVQHFIIQWPGYFKFIVVYFDEYNALTAMIGSSTRKELLRKCFHFQFIAVPYP